MKVYLRKEESFGSQRGEGRYLPPITMREKVPPDVEKTEFPITVGLRELTEQALLQHASLAGALVNGQGDILYLHGRTGMYLEPMAGETGTNNILKMARQGLKSNLTSALRKAVSGHETICRSGVRVKTNGDFTNVNLTVCPVAAPRAARSSSPPLYLIILEQSVFADTVSEKSASAAGAPASPEGELADAGSLAALRKELRDKEEYLQAANEELETGNEELKSSNEEMQSVNEELQSTNEELETSKEELQSVNEELATVNAELQTKVTDLSRANNDMNNLLAATGIGTVFVDSQLRILRFTPAATRIVNLIRGDVGRPLGHIASNLIGYSRLVEDSQDVLDTLVPKEADVGTTEGKWYTMRLQPYRTIDNVIEGVVITFIDITEMKQARDALKESAGLSRLAVVVRDARDAVTVLDLEGRILAWNPGAQRLYGYSEADALTMNIIDLVPESLREEALQRVQQLGRSEVLEPHRTRRIAKGGRVVEAWITATALVNDAGQVYAVATTERECA
jgi:two-component system CheB/CheR fusion protein